jgi:hypothetical protein
MPLVWDSRRAWRGHRTKLSEVAGKTEAGEDVIPNWRRASYNTFLIMMIVIFIAPILFTVFNPLRN